MQSMKRSPLSKRIPRDFIKNFGKYAGMILILVCTISIGSSFQTTLDAALRYLDEIKYDKLQEDGYFETAYEIKDIYEDFYSEKGVRLYENFYALENSFKGKNSEDKEDPSKVIIFNERKEIDLPTLFEGELPKSENEIVLDHVFARGKGIKPGDIIELLDRDFKVSGTVSLPDYSSLFLNNSDLVMNTSHFCVAMVNEDTFNSFSEGSLKYRYSYLLDDRKLSKAERMDVAEDMQRHLIEKGESLQTFLPRDQNQSIVFLELDMGTDGPFMVVFVYMLVALIAFVFAILTNSTIEREAVIIGTLRASGYTRGEVIWHYLQPTLIIGIAGSAIGNILGYTAMIDPMLGIYNNTYSIGPLKIEFSIPAFLTTTILPVALMLIINYLMLVRKLSLSPLKFLRRDLKGGRQKKAIRLPDFGFLSRFRIRVILQNKGNYILLFIGIFFASFLLMFGLGLDPLMRHYTDSIDESLPFEYQYILKAPADTDEGERISTCEMSTWFELGKKDIGITLMGLETESRFFKGALADEGVCISSALSKKMNLREGDKITLKDSNEDKEYEFDITKVYPYSASMSIFMKKEELNNILEKDADSYNCLLSDKELDIDEACVATEISRGDLLGASEQMMNSFSVVIKFINIFSVVVYMVLMYILTKIVIDKNALYISFMKIFGYERKEIRKLYLTATTIVVVTSLIICIPVEILLFKAVLIFLSSMIEGYLSFYLPVSIYVEIVVIGLVAYFLINAVHIHEIKKIPMTEALKNRD